MQPHTEVMQELHAIPNGEDHLHVEQSLCPCGELEMSYMYGSIFYIHNQLTD